MNSLLRTLTFVLLWSLQTLNLFSQGLTLTRVTPYEGVGITATMCIAEDSDGLIWFGTNNGLFRYDSKQIVRYTHSINDENSIPINNINNILCDSHGRLLIATDNGIALYDRDQDNFQRLRLTEASQLLSGRNITHLVQSGDLYYIVDNKGLARFDSDFNRVEYIKIGDSVSPPKLLNKDKDGTLWVVLRSGDIFRQRLGDKEFTLFGTTSQVGLCRAFLVDDDIIWAGYDDGGVVCLNLEGEIINRYNKESGFLSNKIRSIIDAGDGKVLIATYLGLVTMQGSEVLSITDSSVYYDLPHSSIWSLFKDHNENIWIGTWLGGLCFHSDYKNFVNHVNPSTQSVLTSHDVITSFAIDPNSANLWFSTESGYIAKYHQPSNTITKESIIYDGHRVGNIQFITFDPSGKMWVGTRGDGVLYRDSDTRRFAKLSIPYDEGLQTSSILPLKEQVWIGYYQQGVVAYNPKTGSSTQYKRGSSSASNMINDNHIRGMSVDQDGDVWFASLKGLSHYFVDEDRFEHFTQDRADSTSISSNTVYNVVQDSKGAIWAGTIGGGLNKLDVTTSKFSHFTTSDGLLGNDIHSMIIDNDDNLWLATENGVCKFNTTTNKVLSFGNTVSMYNNKFFPNAAIKSSNGIIYFGGTNGFIYFRPEEVTLRNTIAPSTVITNFFIDNNEVKPSDKGVIQRNINDVNSIKLKHNQNSFSFDYVSNNFINPENNTFKYRLVGFEDRWTSAPLGHIVSFTNIPFGSYTFEIMCANNDGVWSEEIKSIDIEITPPIYLRWYALLLYLLVVASIIASLIRDAVLRRRLRFKNFIESQKRKNEEYIYRSKLQFYTNASHEFRTPLTLIIGPINRLINSGEQEDEQTTQYLLQLIKSNSERMLGTVNQLLSFRKAEVLQQSVCPINSDVISFCREIFNSFTEYAEGREIDYCLNCEEQKLMVDFDPDKLDKIVFNIISNAFKHNPDKIKIEMTILNNREFTAPSDYTNINSVGERPSGDFVEIIISDTGYGIPNENLQRLFDRFFSGEKNGLGIGMSMVKDLVIMHHAQLMVYTEHGKGSCFRIVLPHKQSETIINDSTTLELQEPAQLNVEEIKSRSADYSESLILVVEDNIELLDYITSILGRHFKVSKAQNGVNALERIGLIEPDIIISDVMMPQMNGNELCKTIKSDIKTSHIPVILLTALDSMDNKISGLSAGADAYIAKPFDERLLITQVINLLESRKELRAIFAAKSDMQLNNCNHIVDLDKRFIVQATNYIEHNMTNYDLSVDMLASELNISRTTLHRKLKSLSGLSGTEFIRNIRLKSAASLLLSGEHRISEIGYIVGFNSPQYFTSSFSKLYGVSPSEFIKRSNNNE